MSDEITRKEERTAKDYFHSKRAASIYAWYLRRLGYSVDESITLWRKGSEEYSQYTVEGKKTVTIKYRSDRYDNAFFVSVWVLFYLGWLVVLNFLGELNIFTAIFLLIFIVCLVGGMSSVG